jgi:hypothetical protein
VLQPKDQVIMALGFCLVLMLLRAPPLRPAPKPPLAAGGSFRAGPAD